MTTNDQFRQTFLTEEGLRKAEEELRYLKTEKRKLVAEKIESAKELGDLSENAEYAEAKEEQAFTEARIIELDHLLKHAQVVSSQPAVGTVVIGSTVVLEDGESTRSYTVVGFNEANPSAGKISNESPLGQALVGKRAGEVVSFSTPRGARRYTIRSVT